MYCRQCGSANDEQAPTCVRCGETLQSVVPSAPSVVTTVPNHLAWAVVVTVLGALCCWLPLPFGIAAIVFAAQVKRKASAGDLVGAREASRKAKQWSWVAFWVWLACLLFLAWGVGSVLIRAVH